MPCLAAAGASILITLLAVARSFILWHCIELLCITLGTFTLPILVVILCCIVLLSPRRHCLAFAARGLATLAHIIALHLKKMHQSGKKGNIWCWNWETLTPVRFSQWKCCRTRTYIGGSSFAEQQLKQSTHVLHFQWKKCIFTWIKLHHRRKDMKHSMYNIFVRVLEENCITEEKIWNLVKYVTCTKFFHCKGKCSSLVLLKSGAAMVAVLETAM